MKYYNIDTYNIAINKSWVTLNKGKVLIILINTFGTFGASRIPINFNKHSVLKDYLLYINFF